MSINQSIQVFVLQMRNAYVAIKTVTNTNIIPNMHHAYEQPLAHSEKVSVYPEPSMDDDLLDFFTNPIDFEDGFDLCSLLAAPEAENGAFLCDKQEHSINPDIMNQTSGFGFMMSNSVDFDVLSDSLGSINITDLAER